MKLLCAVLCALVLGALAGEWYVNPLDGSDSNPGTSEKPFKTIEHAVDQAESGDVIFLEPGSYNPTSTVTMDKDLELIGTTSRGAVLSWGQDDDDDDKRFFKVTEGTTSLEGIKLIGTEEAIQVQGSGSLNVRGCEFQYCESAIVSTATGSVHITASFFEHLQDVGVSVEPDDDDEGSNASLLIQESTFANCNAETLVYAWGIKAVHARDVTFFNSFVDRVLEVEDVEEVELANVVVADNVAEDGAVWIEDVRSFTIHNSVMQRNRAGDEAGAISVVEVSFMRVYNSSWVLNAAPYEGGAAAFYDSVVIIDQSRFANNSVLSLDGEGGGGIYVDDDSEVLLTNSVVENNQGGSAGGAVCIADGFVNVEDSKITGNSANVGGAFACDGGSVRVDNSVVEDNISFSGNDGGCRI